jgi:type IV pilus assembly protein PilN
MIKINLLGEGAAGDSGAKIALGIYFGLILIFAGAFYFLQSSLSKSVEELSTRSDNLRNELTRVEKVTREVKDLEEKKNEYNSKLIVIALLKKNKLGPVRVLDDLNNALPEKAWLSEVKESEGEFTVVGKALDPQTVAAYIRELTKSEYFGEKSDEAWKDWEKDGIKIKEFSFKTKIFYGGKIAAQQAEVAQAGLNTEAK